MDLRGKVSWMRENILKVPVSPHLACVIGVSRQQQQLLIILNFRLQSTLHGSKLIVESHPLFLREFKALLLFVLFFWSFIFHKSCNS